ncbi:MAG: hypothetical protein U5L96_15120 [Owenweeksia sp.]|nr:hypothetical protein [Owenweeksia sp.]
MLLQGKPANLDLEELMTKIRAVDKVQSLHHTHLWTLDGEHHVFTTHIKLENISRFSEIIELKRRVKDILNKEYQFSHFTIETELDRETCPMID